MVAPGKGAAGIAAQMGAVYGAVGHLGGKRDQRMVRRSGFGVKGIHSNTTQTTIQQGLAHRHAVDQFSAGGVDQNSTGVDMLQKRSVNHVPGLVIHRAVQGDDRAAGDQFLEGEIGDAKFCFNLRGTAMRGVVEQLTAEGAQQPGGGLSDVAKANEANGLFSQLGSLGDHNNLLHLELAALAIAASILLGGSWLEDVRWRIEEWLDNSESAAISRALYEDGEPQWEGERLAVYAPEAEARLGRCTISVPRAAMWEEQGKNVLYLELRLSYDLPWERSEAPLLYLWAEVDRENSYGERQGYTSRGHRQTGLRWVSINMMIENVPRDLECVTLHYLPGTDLDLRVDLKEVAA